MVLSNWIGLTPGLPLRLHFTDYYLMQREIMDKDLGRPKKIWSHVFYVNEADGQPVSRTFSIMSQKLWAHLEPFADNNEYRGYDFIITQMGDGFYKDFNVQAIKRP
uniref:Uncharacterized protein n=1 Tax=viral metagenome TaxID=1070528 RepID=A0A6M3XSQ2_9ZZZZ